MSASRHSLLHTVKKHLLGLFQCHNETPSAEKPIFLRGCYSLHPRSPLNSRDGCQGIVMWAASMGENARVAIRHTQVETHDLKHQRIGMFLDLVKAKVDSVSVRFKHVCGEACVQTFVYTMVL